MEIDISGQNLVEWPELPKDAVALCIDQNELVNIPAEVAFLSELKKLSAAGNEIAYITKEISQLTKLETVNLVDNAICSLPDNFDSLKCLTILNMMGNQLRDLPDSFGELSALTLLDLSENQLVKLPDSFGLLSNLEILEASCNRIKFLPSSFGGLTALKTLNLAQNQIAELPQSFSEISRLEILDLSTNSLASLPVDFKASVTLQKLYLDENCIDCLPSWFGNLPQLEFLSINDNKLVEDSLPVELGNCSPLLEHIDVSGNELTCLPDSIAKLVRLKFIDTGSILPHLERSRNLLNGNMLTKLPLGFGLLVNITELRLDENLLVELPVDIGSLKRLQILDLGQNRICELPDSFCDLTELKTFSIAVNHLTGFPENFGLLQNLRYLRADRNAITSLPDSFGDLLQLENLDLFNNQLPEFPKCLYKLKNLVAIDVELNLFNLADAPFIYKEHKYAERDPALAENWRGKQRPDQRIEGKTITMGVGGTHSDNEEDVDNYHTLRKATENSMSLWRSHNSEISERPAYSRTPSPLHEIDSPYENRDYPGCATDDWENEMTEENPYGTGYVYQHPANEPHNQLRHKFLPAELHRPSFIHLFAEGKTSISPVVAVQRKEAMLFCNFCDGSPKVAVVACETCSYYYCSHCLKKYHPKVGPLKTHNIIKASALSTEDAHCSVHEGEKSSIFCENCEILLCLQCVSHHASHNLLKIEQAYAKCKDRLALMSDRIEHELHEAAKLKKATSDRIAKIQQDSQAAEKKITCEIDFLRNTINGCEKAMLGDVEMESRKKCDILKVACEEIPLFEQNAVKSLAHINSLREQSSIISLLAKFGRIREHVVKLLRAIYDLSNPEDVQISFDAVQFDCTKEVQMIAAKLTVSSSKEQEFLYHNINTNMREIESIANSCVNLSEIEKSPGMCTTSKTPTRSSDFLYRKLPECKELQNSAASKTVVGCMKQGKAKVSSSEKFLNNVISKHPEYKGSTSHTNIDEVTNTSKAVVRNDEYVTQINNQPGGLIGESGDTDVAASKLTNDEEGDKETSFETSTASFETTTKSLGIEVKLIQSERNRLSTHASVTRSLSPLRFITVDDTVPSTAVGVKQRAKESYYGKYQLSSEKETEQ